MCASEHLKAKVFRNGQDGMDFSVFNMPVASDSMGADSNEYGAGLAWMIHGDNLKVQADYRYVTQQLPFGRSTTANKNAQGRTSDWRNFQEFRIQLQWIF